MDLQQLVKQFSQGQSHIPELHWAHAAQRRMHPLLVAPPNAWAELAAELAEVDERPPIDELLLQNSVGELDDGAVVRVALAGEGSPDTERLQQVVDVGVRELAAAICVEHIDVRQREPQRGEGGLHQPRVLPAACRVPHDLAVVQVYEQANVVPFAAYAHVGEIAHDVGMGRAAIELAVEDAFPGSGNPIANKDYEILKLKKENEELRKEVAILKNPGLLEASPSVRFEFARAGEHGMSVKKACEALEPFVEDVFYANNRRDGPRQIVVELRRIGIVANGKTVQRMMARKGLVSCGGPGSTEGAERPRTKEPVS